MTSAFEILKRMVKNIDSSGKKSIHDQKNNSTRRYQVKQRTGIVIPCYNEVMHLEAAQFVDFVRQNTDVHFHFVNDGSKDATQQKIEEIAGSAGSNITFQSWRENRGKAEAVRAGVQALLSGSRFVYVAYWDADLSTPLDEILRFIEAAESRPGIQFVCGSRIRRMGAKIERFWYRHYFGRFFATAASLILYLPIYDTQCGAKLIRAELAKLLFDRPFISRWLFDIELLARMIEALGRNAVIEAVFELPLEKWQDKGGSKVRFSYLPKILIELCRIRLTYRKCLDKKG